MKYFHFIYFLVSKENDLDSNGSSLDTDMEDNTSQSQDSHQYLDPSSTTPVPNSVMIIPPTGNDDIHNISLIEHNDYLSSDLSHIHLLHSNSRTDPILNHHNTTLVNNMISNDLHDYHHGQVLQYFTDTSNDRLRYLKRSKSIITPSTSTISTYDPNGDINFLYDLVTPPAVNRQSISTQINHTDNLFNNDWNTRILLPTPTTASVMDNIKYEHDQQKLLR
jgi:hypothetical protein